MMAVTVDGQAGAGEIEIGHLLAREVNGTYIQKKAIRRVARYLDASVEAVVRKEMAYASHLKRIGHMLELWLAQMGRVGSEPWTLPLMTDEVLCARPGRKVLPGEISDSEYREAVFAVADQFAREGNIVLTHRAGCLTLDDRPEVIHVGLFAPKDIRVSRVAKRFRIGNLEAADWIEAMDRARVAWFKKLAGAHPHDPDLYDITLDATRFMDDEMAAKSIAAAAIEINADLRATGLQPAMA